MSSIRLSIIIIAYNMEREIPRTCRSLSPMMQKDIEASEYEIIVVDNGSSQPLQIPDYGANLRVIRINDASPSPAAAINQGIRLARGEIIGVFIDGARMASPGLLSAALMAAKLHPRPIISTVGFHLGPDIQSKSVLKGYNQSREDALLAKSEWEADGYRLFEISVFAGSSSRGWFAPMGESNGVFLTRAMWDELGGYDESFVCRGGGLVNLDTYARSCELKDSQLIILLGEGTFHQVHGGTASNAAVSPWDEFHAEYVHIRGRPFKRPEAVPIYIGSIPAAALPFIEQSARQLRSRSWRDRFKQVFFGR